MPAGTALKDLGSALIQPASQSAFSGVKTHAAPQRLLVGDPFARLRVMGLSKNRDFARGHPYSCETSVTLVWIAVWGSPWVNTYFSDKPRITSKLLCRTKVCIQVWLIVCFEPNPVCHEKGRFMYVYVMNIRNPIQCARMDIYSICIHMLWIEYLWHPRNSTLASWQLWRPARGFFFGSLTQCPSASGWYLYFR